MDEIGGAFSDSITSSYGHVGWELRKVARAGGPVTCVCLRSVDCSSPQHEEGTSLARIWALGPYLFRSFCGTKEQTLIFPQDVGGTIHGISFREQSGAAVDEASSSCCWDAIVYGARQLAVCRVVMGLGSEKGDSMKIHRLNLSHDNKRKSHLTVSDWIWDVKILDDFADGGHKDNISGRGGSIMTTLALGLARHTVELWRISPSVSDVHSEPGEQDSLETSLLRRIPGSPPCLVMSMNLWQQDNRLWITAGTAFQVIQVWSISLGGDSSEPDEANEACLTGHKGVIHSVEWSRDVQSIVSTSDDRSVRLWTYQSRSEDSVGKYWGAKWVAWGHTARVWSASFTVDAVVSVAEDATTRIWSMETGEELCCIRHSTGLWSVCIWDDLAMVGATDGTTALYNLSQKIPGRQLEVIDSILIPDDRPKISEEFQDAASSEELTNHGGANNKKKKTTTVHGQVVVGMLWINGDEILVATRAGSLMTLSVTTRIWSVHQPWWTTRIASHGISSSDGCCMAYCNEVVAIGTTTGDIVVVRLGDGHTDNWSCSILSGKQFKSVHRLKWHPQHGMLISLHVRSAAVWMFSETGVEHVEAKTEPNVVMELETRGSPRSCFYDHEQKQFLIGDTRGNLALFQLPSVVFPVGRTMVVRASSILTQVHKREHVNDISLQGDTIRSVGNDGSIYTAYRRQTSLHRGFSVPVMSMTGLNEILTPPEKFDRCIISGFYGNVYRIVDAVTGLEVFEMNTGGRQRLHDLFIPATEIAEFGLKHMAVCMAGEIGTNRIMIHRQLSNRIERIMGHTIRMSEGIRVHGETIFDSCFMSLGENSPATFMLTASEDCGTKIFCVRENCLSDVMSLTPQESCVRAVCTSQVDCTSSLIVVGGGKLTIQFFIAKSTKSGSPTVSSLNDIEISFLRHGFSRDRASIDQRVNVVKASPLQDSGLERYHLVVAADSAGQCFLDIVSEDTCAPPLAGVFVQVSDHPILSMALLPLLGRILVVFGTTAGAVILYELPGSEVKLRELWPTLATSWKPVASFQAHQMGTNAMSLSAVIIDGINADVLIFSGGDDQAISVCKFRLGFSSVTSSISSGPFSIRTEVHASYSAVKGVFEVQSASKSCKYFVTAGYTQTVALWKWENETLEVVMNLPVDIGDVNALAAYSDGNGALLVAVVGLGIELFSLTAL